MKTRLLIYFLFQGLFSFGQTLFKFEHLTVNEGLSHSDAMAVIQDQAGFIWVGTNKGLDRYDGYSLKNYRLPYRNVNGQYTNRILGLHLSQNKTLWVVAETQGVFFFDPVADDFKNLADLATSTQDAETLRNITARSLTTNASGDLYIGSSTQGLFVIKLNAQGKIKSIKNVPFPYQGINALIFALARDAEQRIWVGTVGAGLWYLDETENPRPFTPWKEGSIIRAILPSKDKKLWVASEEGVIKIDGLTGFRPLDQRFNYLTSLLEDSYGRLWIGSRTGLYLISELQEKEAHLTGNLEHFAPGASEGLNYHLIHNLVEDNFNNLWIAASAGGLNKVNLLPKPFYKLQKSNAGLPNDYANTLCQDKEEDVLWIGTRSGFARYDLKTRKSIRFLDHSNLKDNPAVDVTAIYDTGKGKLWIGTRVHGIFILDKKTLALKALPELPGQKAWKQAEPISITSDPAGRIWVACFYDGLHIFTVDGKPLRSFSKAQGTFPSSRLTFLLPTSEGMYLSTRDHGLLLLDPSSAEVKKTYSFDPNGLKTDYIWPLLKSKSGEIWIGTIGGGLHKLNPQTGAVQRLDSVLPETDVESLQEDEHGNIWVGGNGLYRFNPVDQTYLHFDVADGLQSNSFKVASAAKGRNGFLYFGGINGVSYFHPENVSTNPHPPKMQINQVRILNYAYSPDLKNDPRALLSGPFTDDSEITIRNFENDFSIEFVGLNYINPGKQHYEYMLEGFHKNWIALPPGQRVMGFSNLPAGNYTFLVKGDNGDGVWTEKPARLKLRILPPWYQTAWAYLIYAILVTAAIIWYKRVTGKQRELKNKIALEQVAKEKEKELSELKLNFFTNVSHELRTPLTLIMSPSEFLIKNAEPGSEVRQKAELVHRQAHKLLDLVNQLMNFRKVETGNLSLQMQTLDIVPFITEIYLLFKIKADELDIQYLLDMPNVPVYVEFDPEKLEIVFSNLLSNAFKFTPASGTIFLKGEIVDQHFTVRVQDDGIGIHPDEVQHIFEPFYQAYKQRGPKSTGTGIGLSLVAEFVKKQNGTLDVSSTPGKGSTFKVTLPLSTQLPASPQENPVEEINADIAPNPNLEHKLLIVEDNEDLRNYLVSLFHTTFETHSAENGKEGWEKTKMIHPDLILSDVMMPVMNGLEFCEKIKSHPKTAHIPLVLLTARAATVHELEGLESGADDYMVKPFNPKILHSKLLSLLNNRKKTKEFFHKQVLAEPSESIIPDVDKAFLENSMQIIEDNLTNPLFNVQTLVRESGMSQSAYYRRLKNLTGQSVIEFIKDVRLKRAAQLLASKQFRVSEVALMVGMEDLKNFRSSFQKLYGVSPSEYGK
jgi:signal transduction histidine kinase/ligand-binding sensor domain-containing protein/CheY-like chemotaxis protein/AraC-like DNA-binding protein